MARLDAASWWARLQDRYAHVPVDWQGAAEPGATLPAGLFDSVAENLLQNALAKRLREPGLVIAVAFVGCELIVSDSGSAIPNDLANALMNEPVSSDDGLGIGLYQAARHAESLGYRLALAENQAGSVVFRLSPRP
jgi:sensor histidine kinase regulating citrate/malate metabolism